VNSAAIDGDRGGIGRAHAIVERDARVIVSVPARTDIKERGLPCREMQIGIASKRRPLRAVANRPRSESHHEFVFKSDQWLDGPNRNKSNRPAATMRKTSATIGEMNAVHIATT